MTMKTKHVVYVGAGTVLLVSAIVVALRPQPVVVDTAVVRTGLLESTINADGQTRVRERYTLVAPVSGRIERLHLAEGAEVHTGDIVAQILPAPLDSEGAQLVQARADAAAALVAEVEGQHQVAKATLDQRRRELGRALRLLEVGGVAPRVVEEHQLAVAEAEQAVQSVTARTAAARANYRESMVRLQSREHQTPVLLRAPASGRILRVSDRSERIVLAGAPVMELGDPSSLEVVIDILSADAQRVRPGDVVRFDEWRTGRGAENNAVIQGRIRAIEPAGITKVSALGIDEQRVNVVVDVAELPPGVADGYRVEGNIIVWSRPDALILPRSALVRDAASLEGESAGDWSVFVAANGRAERRPVRIGHLAGLSAEVVQGVTAGDEVILYPAENVQTGTRVRSRR
jgi:HlyD family secretion protein